MALNSKQEGLVREAQTTASEFVKLQENIALLAAQYADGVMVGITDEDLEPYGITTTDLSKIVTTNTELVKFWNNQTVTARNNGQFMRNLMNAYL